MWSLANWLSALPPRSKTHHFCSHFFGSWWRVAGNSVFQKAPQVWEVPRRGRQWARGVRLFDLGVLHVMALAANSRDSLWLTPAKRISGKGYRMIHRITRSCTPGSREWVGKTQGRARQPRTQPQPQGPADGAAPRCHRALLAGLRCHCCASL